MNNFYEFNHLLSGSPITFSSKLIKQTSFPNLRASPTIKKSLPPLSRKNSCSGLLKLSSTKSLISKKNPLIIPQIYEDPPSFPPKSNFNERFLWKKRKLGKMPLLLIVFEGVLGFYSKPNLWSSCKASFTVREDLFSGICELRKHFYVALVSTYTKTVTKEMMNLIDSRQSLLDAVYIQRYKGSQQRCTHDVASILEDFGITNKAAVIGLCAVGIENSEILQRRGLGLVIEKSVSKHKQCLTYFAPACEKDCPVTVLVSHFEFLNKFQSFLDISEFLIGLKKMNQDFFVGFEKYDGLKVKTCLKNGGLKGIRRFVFFTKENEEADRGVACESEIGR